MIVKTAEWEKYRNLKTGSITPGEEVNVIYGDNAQGKTNLLELIWIFTGGRSFRAAKDEELVAFGEKRAIAALSFFAQGREQTAKIEINGKRRCCELNEIAQKSAAALIGRFCAAVFSPGHLSLIQDGPAGRRKFLDTAICQQRPAYAQALLRYRRGLEQRNALLKDLRRRPALEGILTDWDEKLAELGALVVRERARYIKKLTPFAQEVYSGISAGRERLSLLYRCGGVQQLSSAENLTGREVFCALQTAISHARAADLAAGFSTVGPHRDDFDLQINDIGAKAFGSQGQQRSAVLALKLGEAALLQQESGEKPVILLDDVMSELDGTRQDYLLNRMKGWQVFITCCDPAPILQLTGGTVFQMADGMLTKK